MTEQVPDNTQRWTAKRRNALVLSILKGETSAKEAARKHGLKVGEIEEWKDRFLLGAENSLRSRPRDEEALKDEQINRLKRKIGDLVMDLDIIQTAIKLKEEREGRPSLTASSRRPYRKSATPTQTYPWRCRTVAVLEGPLKPNRT